MPKRTIVFEKPDRGNLIITVSLLVSCPLIGWLSGQWGWQYPDSGILWLVGAISVLLCMFSFTLGEGILSLVSLIFFQTLSVEMLRHNDAWNLAFMQMLTQTVPGSVIVWMAAGKSSTSGLCAGIVSGFFLSSALNMPVPARYISAIGLTFVCLFTKEYGNLESITIMLVVTGIWCLLPEDLRKLAAVVFGYSLLWPVFSGSGAAVRTRNLLKKTRKVRKQC